jgi:hypothetical protein
VPGEPTWSATSTASALRHEAWGAREETILRLSPERGWGRSTPISAAPLVTEYTRTLVTRGYRPRGWEYTQPVGNGCPGTRGRGTPEHLARPASRTRCSIRYVGRSARSLPGRLPRVLFSRFPHRPSRSVRY